MILADVLAWLDCSELSLPQLCADSANGFALCRVLGEAHNQTIRELLARLVAVNVGHNHGGRACAIKLLDELPRLRLGRIARGLEPSQRTASLDAVLLLQPSPPFATVLFFQERGDEDAKNMFLRCLVLRQKLRRLTPKSRQRFILRRGITIRVWADDSTIQIETLGEQRAVTEPEAISSAELAAHRGDFQLKLPVVMPGPLDACPFNHLVFAEQSPRFIKLAADTVRQAVFVGLFRCEHSVLVPSTNDPVPVTVPHRYSFTKLTASIKVPSDGGAHYVRIRCRLFPPSDSIQPSVAVKANAELFTAFGNGRGANSTGPHENHREAPLREARQAAPGWTRASAAPPSIENSRISGGTEPLRRKSYSMFVTSCLPACSIAESTISEIRGRLQPCPDRRLKLPDFARCLASFALAEIPRANFLGFAVERPPQDFQRSAATDFSDENLEAKTPGGVGRVKEERKPLNRSILDAPDAVIQSDSVSSRCHGDGSNDSSRSAW